MRPNRESLADPFNQPIAGSSKSATASHSTPTVGFDRPVIDETWFYPTHTSSAVIETLCEGYKTIAYPM